MTNFANWSSLTNAQPNVGVAVLDPNDQVTAPANVQGSNKTIPMKSFYQSLGGAHSTKLLPWFAKLAGRQTARANVVILGDSITAGQGASTFANTYVQILASMLNTRFPTPGLSSHGRGFLPPIIPPSNPSTINSSYGSIVTVANSTNLTAGSLFGYGPNLETWDITHTATNTLTYSLVGDSADILWAGNPSNGTFEWKVDAGSFTTVSTNVAFGTAYVTHVSLGSAGAHTLTITNASGSPTYITGVVEYNGDYASGIQVHNCGFSGSTTGYWTSAGGDVSGSAALAALSPSLIIIELCANDNGNGITATTSTTNLNSLISSIRSALSPAPPILLLGLYNAASDGPTTPTQWAAYINAMYGIAAGDSAIDILDLTLRMPSTGAASTYSLYNVDGIHPNNAGHQMIADVLCQYLSPA